MSIVNSPLWRPAGVMVMFQVSMISDEDIPMLNDECVLDYDGKPVMTDGKETPILEWMAAQKKA